MLQVCLEGAADSAWMQRGGKLLGITLAALPRTGACILVGMSGLGLEVLKLEKGVCLFSRKLRPFQLEGFCGSSRKCRESSLEEEDQRSKAVDE